MDTEGSSSFLPANAPTITSHSSPSPPPSLSAPFSPDPGPARAKRRRNTSSAPTDCCRTCRLRKVKCTGNPGNGPCANCSRLDLICTFCEAGEQSQDQAVDKVARTTPSKSHTEAGTVRKRAQRACGQCHAHKTKCSGDLPRCKRCEAGDLVCEYTPAKRKFANVQFNVSSLGPSGPTGPVVPGSSASNAPPKNDDREPGVFPTSKRDDFGSVRRPASQISSLSSAPYETSHFAGEALFIRKEILATHMKAYYDHLYHLPCYGFFHPERTRREIHEDRFHPGLAAAVCSVTSWLVSPGEARRDFARKCSEQVDFHIFRNIGNFSELSLTLLVLANLYNWMDGQYGKMWMYTAQAARLIQALQLNWDLETPSVKDGFIEQEIRRRLAWQIYLTDHLLAGGFDGYLLCPDKSMFLRLPCDEQSFQNNVPIDMDRLELAHGQSSKENLGLYAHHIRIASVRHQILAATKRYTGDSPGVDGQSAQLEPSQVMEDVNRLQIKLSNLRESIPHDLRLSDQTVQSYIGRPEQASFVMLHTWIGQLYVDLYRFSIPDIQERASADLIRKLPPEFVAKSQKQAVAHAISLSRFWGHVYGMMASSPFRLITTDFMMSICISQTSHVVLAARKHGLYHDLSKNSTAPLWRSEEVDDHTLSRLIASNMEVLRPMAEMVPRVASLEKSLLAKIEEFATFTDNGPRMDVHAGDQSGQIRLPGPHYLLENALSKDTTGPPPPQTTYHTEPWLPQPPQHGAPIPTPMFPPDKQVDFAQGRLGIPLLLAQAMGTFGHVPPLGQQQQQQQKLSQQSHYGGDHDNLNQRVIPVGNQGGIMGQAGPTPLTSVEGMGQSSVGGGPSVERNTYGSSSQQAQYNSFGTQGKGGPYPNPNNAMGGGFPGPSRFGQ